MKKNKMMRLASGLMVAVLLTTSMISGTFAKYISTATNSDSARVALWDIEVNDSKLSVANPTVVFDLFADTVNDTLGGVESDVKTGESIIAPGTTGSFALKIENLSEVNAEYTIALKETNEADIPIQYRVDNGEWKDSIDDVATELTKKAINMGSSAVTKTIEWQWAFERNADAADTALGIVGTDTVKIEATITVTQVD